MVTEAYHTALRSGTVQTAAPVERLERRGCVLLRHNIVDGVPADMASCDVLYADLPWRHGFDVFNVRAGVQSSLTWKVFMGSVGTAIHAVQTPTVLVLGAEGAKLLPAPDVRRAVLLNGSEAVLVGWRIDLPPFGSHVMADAVIAWLAIQPFTRVGDFCCGYGRTGRIFLGRGKTCVLSDYNATCLGYIASQIDRW